MKMTRSMVERFVIRSAAERAWRTRNTIWRTILKNSNRMEDRTRRIMYGAAALEFAVLARLLFAPPHSNDEFHQFVDEGTKKSKSFKRLWMVFLFALGGSRLAVARSHPGPSPELKTFALGLHLAELIFFYSEAKDNKTSLSPAHYAFLAILWGMPYTLAMKV